MQKVLTLAADTVLTAYYEQSVPVSLVVISSPIAVKITVDGYQYDTSTSISLQPGDHTIVVPSNAVSGSDIYNFKQWDDGLTNPIRTVHLTEATTVIGCTYQTQVTPPATGNLEIHAFLDTVETMVPYEIVGASSGNTPATVMLDVGQYTVNVTCESQTQTQVATVVDGQTIRLDFRFTGATVKHGCFIATAAYGSPFTKELYVLRGFRDNFMAKTVMGRTLRDIYYSLSPPLAKFIAGHNMLKFSTRTLLNPIVKHLKKEK